VLGSDDAVAFERCISVGGVVVFPSDTVYGLACDPDNEDAVHRLYGLKRRRPERAAAVMFFALDLALAALPHVGPRTQQAMRALLPGPVTLLVPNADGRFPLACREDPETLGVRVPRLGPAAAALGVASWPVLQSSANLSGGADARRLGDVPHEIREGADLLLDGGELPGTASTVVDLRGFEADAEWTVRREGARPAADIAAALRNV
jgi:L-threonylcarbamoyladenylate synthase